MKTMKAARTAWSWPGTSSTSRWSTARRPRWGGSTAWCWSCARGSRRASTTSRWAPRSWRGASIPGSSAGWTRPPPDRRPQKTARYRVPWSAVQEITSYHVKLDVEAARHPHLRLGALAARPRDRPYPAAAQGEERIEDGPPRAAARPRGPRSRGAEGGEDPRGARRAPRGRTAWSASTSSAPPPCSPASASTAGRLLGLPVRRKPLCVPWDLIDLRDPAKPRLMCSLAELEKKG